MALAALIAAVREAEDGSGLVGTLPVAGRTLIERQARLAARAGASHVVLLVERLPAGLTGAIDRLRRDGITIDVARSAGDAADRFHPDERVLVFADGALAGNGAIDRLVTGPAPALLTIGESGPTGPVRTNRRRCALGWAGARVGRHAAQDGRHAGRLGSPFDPAAPRGGRVGATDRHRRWRRAGRGLPGDDGALARRRAGGDRGELRRRS